MASLAAEPRVHGTKGRDQIPTPYIVFRPLRLKSQRADEIATWLASLPTQLDNIDDEIAVLETRWYASLSSVIRKKIKEEPFRAFTYRTRASVNTARDLRHRHYVRHVAPSRVS